MICFCILKSSLFNTEEKPSIKSVLFPLPFGRNRIQRDFILVYFSGLSNRIIRKNIFSHWRMEPVYISRRALSMRVIYLQGCWCFLDPVWATKLQLTLVISTSLISKSRLSRSEKSGPCLNMKIKQQVKNIVEKRRNCSSSFPQYFQYIS